MSVMAYPIMFAWQIVEAWCLSSGSRDIIGSRSCGGPELIRGYSTVGRTRYRASWGCHQVRACQSFGSLW